MSRFRIWIKMHQQLALVVCLSVILLRGIIPTGVMLAPSTKYISAYMCGEGVVKDRNCHPDEARYGRG
jgi:hypothetical protein